MMLKKINEVKVNKVRLKKKDKLPTKGAELFADPYGNIACIAKKKSGKSTVIATILRKCTDKKTNVHIFASTVHKDAVWLEICRKLENRGNLVTKHTSIIGEHKQNYLNDIIEPLKIQGADESEEEEESDEESEEDTPWVRLDELEEEKKRKRKPPKPKWLAPKRVFIFDDMGEALRHKSVQMLLKANRHYFCKVILSFHYITDLEASARRQVDTFLVFAGQTLEKLKTIYDAASPHVTFEEFVEMYKIGTADRYNFLYIDTQRDEFRKNFDLQFIKSS